MKKPFYITTSIAYVNAEPHIGFAQELVAADVVARFHRLQGKKVFFLTGTDEHGSKIARAAEEAKKSPKEFSRYMTKTFLDLQKLLNLSNDDFIRTSEKRHYKTAQELWKKVYAAGKLYRKEYEGLYCTGCEAFVREKDLVDGKDPIHGTVPEKIKEENWFFKLSEYTEQIKELITSGTLQVDPETRRNEILSLLDEGLEDISVSRPKSKLAWGVPVPDDPDQVMYVWFDALSNYLDPSGVWPADIHVIGKDILRFHTALWPAMLLAAKMELPRRIVVHGFISVEGQKMSKSVGNVIHPKQLVEKFGVDGARYILLRELSFRDDSDFSWKNATARYNADLANNIGNLLNRVITLAKRANLHPHQLPGHVHRAEVAEGATANFQFQEALEHINRFADIGNRIIDEQKPWELVKKEPKAAQILLERLFHLLYQIGWLLSPYTPTASQQLVRQLDLLQPKPLFPKIEEKK